MNGTSSYLVKKENIFLFSLSILWGDSALEDQLVKALNEMGQNSERVLSINIIALDY